MRLYPLKVYKNSLNLSENALDILTSPYYWL